MPKSREMLSSDDSSDNEVQDRKIKKKKREDDEVEEKSTSSKKAKKESKEEQDVWELGNNKRVNVREFKGKILVDIREMYLDKAGDIKPGKKGISLNMIQWRKFMDQVQEVDEYVKSKC